MFTLTLEQYSHLLPHVLREIGVNESGDIILKCQDCDRVMRWTLGQKPETLVEGELVDVDINGKRRLIPCAHAFSRGGLQVGRMSVQV